MQAVGNFSSCGAEETVSRAINFAPGLASGETLTGTPTCTITVVSGTDSSPSSRLLGGPTISGTQVGVLLGTMLSGTTYQIEITVHTSNSQVLACYALQPVVAL